MKPDDKEKLTSLQAAALILSEGRTDDVEKAELLASGNELDMEALQRAHLRRMMGFDFRMKFRPNKIHVSTTQDPYLSTHCKLQEGDTDKYGNIVNPDVIPRLVAACVRLKAKYDREMAKR